jgi:hypothetical protein
VVEVSQRVVSGSAETVVTILSSGRHKACPEQPAPSLSRGSRRVNAAFIERVNLTLRAHIPALGRKVLSFAKTFTGLTQQVNVMRTYYNFCQRMFVIRPHRSLCLPLSKPIPTKGNGSPKRW